jgi:molybdate transport system permease protein
LALSFAVAGVATVAAAVVGVGVAALVSRLRRPLAREIADALLIAPLVLPPTVLGYALLVALGRRSVVGKLWETAFGSPLVFSRTGAIVAAFVAALPFVVRSARAALEGVDPLLVATARSLGASRWRVFYAIELPLARGGVLAGVLLGFARSLGDFGITLMVAGDLPGQTRTASLAIYDALSGGREAEATALSLALGASAFVLLVAAGRLGRA